MSGSLSLPPYAQNRADYARSKDPDALGALVLSVAPDSPAYEAGIEPGMRIYSVNGTPLTDMIDWLWEASDAECELEVFDPRDGALQVAALERFPGEDWGIEFDGAVFDGMRTCVNACTFCFMRMLPKDMRGTLYIRDDDYRLSFLQGNFVTLTNVSDDDVDRIITHRLSPMNVSLHAVSPDVRRRLMGRNAGRGIEVLERLIDADIEIHAQIVLVPGENDGEELERTLTWCAERPQVTSLGIVPLGYTRFQTRFTSSYSDDPASARAVIEQVRPFQEEARKRSGRTVFQLADEFYLDADVDVPTAGSYDGYPQYYDGIGMIRSYLDETAEVLSRSSDELAHIRNLLERESLELVVLSGAAAARTIANFVASPQLDGRVVTIYNEYFGGNVDVTGLMCACDILQQLPEKLTQVMLIVPDVIFNADGMTLDGYHRSCLIETLEARGAKVVVSSTMPHDLIHALVP